MVENITKLVVYLLSMACVMYGLESINFEKLLKKDRVRQFYFFYLVLVLALTYLCANLILDVISIRFY